MNLTSVEQRFIKTVLLYNQQYLFNSETTINPSQVYRSGWTVLIPPHSTTLKFSRIISDAPLTHNNVPYLENISSDEIDLKDERCSLIMNVTQLLIAQSTQYWINGVVNDCNLNKYCGIANPRVEIKSFKINQDLNVATSLPFKEYKAVLFTLLYDSPITFLKGLDFYG